MEKKKETDKNGEGHKMETEIRASSSPLFSPRGEEKKISLGPTTFFPSYFLSTPFSLAIQTAENACSLPFSLLQFLSPQFSAHPNKMLKIYN